MGTGSSIIDNGGCPFCLAQSTGYMRLDCKGRPYFGCHGCGTKAFLHSPVAAETFKWILSNGTNYARMAAAAAAQVPQPVQTGGA